MKKKLLALMVALLLVVLAACGGASKTADLFLDEGNYSAKMAAVPREEPAAGENGTWAYSSSTSAGGGETSANSYGSDVKMIYRASLELESTEFDTATGDIGTLVEQLGQHRTISYK